MRVAITLEQCWHRVPGGTARAALRLAEHLPAVRRDVELIGVAGRHRRPPASFVPRIEVRQLPLRAPWLYESSLRFGWPLVESAVESADLVHCTTVIPFATRRPLVVTLHDLAFRRHPEFFTTWGNYVFRRSLALIARQARLVMCSSQATVDDCLDAGLVADRVRLVPLGVTIAPVADRDVARVRARYRLPDRYCLFVGTVEPRKNLSRLLRALETGRTSDDLPPLVIVGAAGWGAAGRAVERVTDGTVRWLGFVDDRDLPAVYAGAAVMCYPSLWEGFGLPILEAMAQGTPVVTSRGVPTEEAAGGAAVLVDPMDIESIGDGIRRALADADDLARRGRARARDCSWDRTATLTATAYDDVVGDS